MAATVILGIIFLVAHAAGLNYAEIEAECAKKSNLNVELLKEIEANRPKLQGLPEEKAFIECFSTADGFIKDGKLDATIAKEKASRAAKAQGVPADERYKKVDECIKVAEEKKTTSEKAYAYHDCYIKAFPDDIRLNKSKVPS